MLFADFFLWIWSLDKVIPIKSVLKNIYQSFAESSQDFYSYCTMLLNEAHVLSSCDGIQSENISRDIKKNPKKGISVLLQYNIKHSHSYSLKLWKF